MTFLLLSRVRVPGIIKIVKRTPRKVTAALPVLLSPRSTSHKKRYVVKTMTSYDVGYTLSNHALNWTRKVSLSPPLHSSSIHRIPEYPSRCSSFHHIQGVQRKISCTSLTSLPTPCHHLSLPLLGRILHS